MFGGLGEAAITNNHCTQRQQSLVESEVGVGEAHGDSVDASDVESAQRQTPRDGAVVEVNEGLWADGDALQGSAIGDGEAHLLLVVVGSVCERVFPDAESVECLQRGEGERADEATGARSDGELLQAGELREGE